MVTNELSKVIKLYTSQFDETSLNLFGQYKLQRLSMDMDAIIFRMEYMLNHNLDLDKTSEMSKKYSELNKDFCRSFAKVIVSIIEKKINKSLNDIDDIIVSDIEMGPEYTKCKICIYAQNEDLLSEIDSTFIDYEITNLDNKFFRFNVDSYNDGIAKAYPELFANKTQDIVGTGADKDVFCHSVTLQVGERCSLNCTYCFAGDTYIMMENGVTKHIKDVKVGDYVMGFNEHPKLWEGHLDITFTPARVTDVFKHKSKTVTIEHPYISTTKVTKDHPILTHRGKFIEVRNLKYERDGIMHYNHRKALPMYVYDISRESIEEEDVYNLTTETGTYIANGLLVHNCYQFNKSEMRMSFDTAKEFIDKLLANEYSYVNQYNSPAIILEFIGGEPLLEIDLITKIYEYFLDQAYKLNHPYFTMHRLSICSNGMQYFDEAVQNFFKKYSSRVSFNISIDGNKELHDSCRIQPNGQGSYDVDIAALNHYNRNYSKERNSKMTLAPSNIKYLFDSVKDFIDTGTHVINLNCVFEEGWKLDHANEEYKQLKKLADYIITNGLEHIYLSIFRETPDGPLDKSQDNTSCGGAGSMLAVRANGDIYPCLRYMPSSVGSNVKDLKMGNVHDGMIGREEGSDVLKILDNITRRSSTNDICFECPIANACMTCIALGHTVFGTPGKRTTFTCNMVKAEHLANVYFWNKLAIVHPEYKIPLREILINISDAKAIIGKDSVEELLAIVMNRIRDIMMHS